MLAQPLVPASAPCAILPSCHPTMIDHPLLRFETEGIQGIQRGGKKKVPSTYRSIACDCRGLRHCISTCVTRSTESYFETVGRLSPSQPTPLAPLHYGASRACETVPEGQPPMVPVCAGWRGTAQITSIQLPPKPSHPSNRASPYLPQSLMSTTVDLYSVPHSDTLRLSSTVVYSNMRLALHDHYARFLQPLSLTRELSLTQFSESRYDSACRHGVH